MKRGRKSKYDIEINKSKVWNVAVYIRLSVQDGDKAESNSVINQKKLLNMYLEQDKELNVKEYYIDDGFSGTTFDRPAFKKMMKDIEKEIVNTVIVKDLSRFGRNYIEVGNKINSFMKQNKERAISIISGEYYEDVLSTLPVTIANNSHVKGNIKAPKVTVGNHVVIEGDIEADNDITIGNMCEIGNMLSDENIFVGQMCIVGKVSAGATAYIMGYSAADSVFGDVEVIAENGCDLGNVQSFGTVTLATRTLVKACCGSDLVDCFENVNAEYLMSEGQIRTGEECHIKEMQLKKFN